MKNNSLKPGNRGRTPLARAMPDTMDVEQIKRKAWAEQGILVVSVDTVVGWMERQMLENIGTALYGKRKRKGV